LKEIRDVRAANNDQWMSLVKLALDAAEEEAKIILLNINYNDTKIGKLMLELGLPENGVPPNE